MGKPLLTGYPDSAKSNRDTGQGYREAGVMGTWRKRIAGIAGGIVLILGVLLVGSAVHLFPQLRNPFSQTTTERSSPVVLKSIVQLSRYEAASGNFQVVVDISSGGIL